MTPEERKRRAARQDWPVRIVGLGDESTGRQVPETTPEDRLLTMWTLAVDAWTLSGRSMPTYQRPEIPIRLIRTREN
jgi:hypothetical protein